MKFIDTVKSRAKQAFSEARSYSRELVVAGTSLVAASGSFAAGPDFTALTGAIDFSTTTAAILAAAALVAVLYLAIRGARTVLGFIKR